MKNKLLHLLGFKRKAYGHDSHFMFSWGEFSWHPRKLELSLRACNFGGFESRDLLIFKPLICSFYIYTSKEYDRHIDDNGYSYGFYIYDWYSLNLGWGRWYKSWDFPYIARVWNRTEIYDVRGNLRFVERKGEKTCDERYKTQNQIKVSYPYKYVLKNGEVQDRDVKVHVSNVVWTRKWFPFLEVNMRCIDVEFSDEVGEQTGSWKGGCIGCSYELRDGESTEECLRRMERERKF